MNLINALDNCHKELMFIHPRCLSPGDFKMRTQKLIHTTYGIIVNDKKSRMIYEMVAQCYQDLNWYH